MTYDLSKHDFNNPNPWVALELDTSTFLGSSTKAALLRGNSSKSHQFILPIIRIIGRLATILARIVRLFIPSIFTSSKLLHRLIVWGMKIFLSADANYLIFRHFHIGSQILQFLTDNVEGVTVQLHPLKPVKIDDFAPNTYLQHDLNIYNFIIQINAQGGQFKQVPLENIDFSAIEDFELLLPKMPHSWHNFLDLQSAIEIYTPVFAIFLSERDFVRSCNSLQLDETMAIYVGKLFNQEYILGLVNNKHPCVPLSVIEAGLRLMLHGLDAENLYGFIKYMRDQKQRGSVLY